MPYISVSHSLKIDRSAHTFSERFTENKILLLYFQWRTRLYTGLALCIANRSILPQG